jgi:hypothetical protein
MAPPLPTLPYELIDRVLHYAGALDRLWVASQVCKLWAAAAAEKRKELHLLQHEWCTQNGGLRFPCAMSVVANSVIHSVARAREPHSAAASDDATHLLICEAGGNEPGRFRVVRLPPGMPEARDHALVLASNVDPRLGGRHSTAPSGMACAAPFTVYVGVAPFGFDHYVLPAFVSDAGSDRLHAFTITFSLDGPFSSLNAESTGAYGEGVGEFIAPSDLCLGGDGLLFVSEGCSVSAFDVSDVSGEPGELFVFSHKWGKRGSGDGEFRLVGGLAAHADGELFCADVKNHRIQVFTAKTGDFRRTFGQKGKRPGEYARPCAIALVSGRLVVAELTGKRLQIVSRHTGAPLQMIADALPGGPVRFACFHEDVPNGKLYAATAAKCGQLHCFDIRRDAGDADTRGSDSAHLRVI